MRLVAVGDLIGKFLSAIGITKSRVTYIAGQDCGCDGRRSAANAWGISLQNRMIMGVGGYAMMSPSARRRFARKRLFRIVSGRLRELSTRWRATTTSE
jgi:hypothetical protein